jgi:hypothetical protein
MLDNIQFNDPTTQIVGALLGLAILLFGRRLFWLTVAIVGFAATFIFVADFFQDQPAWLTLIIALVAGIIGALLAVVLQEVAIAIAGFFTGGYASLWFLQLLNMDLSQWNWVVFVIAGLLGAILAVFLFDPALIILSAVIGAALILQLFQLPAWLTIVLFIILVFIGIAVQTRLPAETVTRVRRVRRVSREE